MSGEIVITLPIPDAKLSANARCHWSVKRRITKQHRELAKVLARQQLKFQKPQVQGYRLVFTWPNNIRRDKRNASERCKAYEDGIADWLGQDDSLWEFWGVEFTPADKQKPRVEFHFKLKEEK